MSVGKQASNPLLNDAKDTDLIGSYSLNNMFNFKQSSSKENSRSVYGEKLNIFLMCDGGKRGK